ncbi:hypothetical protein GmHk_08G022286 [Glycine max]|nr:hypothetical protein GmHk_08G022286 [Glycine max]
MSERERHIEREPNTVRERNIGREPNTEREYDDVSETEWTEQKSPHFTSLNSLRREGRRYGFVRYKGISDKGRIEKELDNSIVRDLKLHVNTPKYGRGKTKMDQYKVVLVKKGEGVVAHDQREEVSFRTTKNKAPKKSYAEAVALSSDNNTHRGPGGAQVASYRGSQSSIALDISMEDIRRHENVWVGRLKKLEIFERLEDEVSWKLGPGVSPKYLGDDMTLLLGLSDTRATEIIAEEIEQVVWTIDNIRKIVAAVGDLVEVDDDVEHMQRLDRARVLVRTPRPPLIQQVEVHAGGETYRVHMVEENGSDGSNNRCRERCRWESSEEIISDDDDMDSVQSWRCEAAPSSQGENRVGDRREPHPILLPTVLHIADDPVDGQHTPYPADDEEEEIATAEIRINIDGKRKDDASSAAGASEKSYIEPASDSKLGKNVDIINIPNGPNMISSDYSPAHNSNLIGPATSLDFSTYNTPEAQHNISANSKETKKENFNKLTCQSIWGDSNVSWDSVPSVHTFGGLLCLWNNSAFEEIKSYGSRFTWFRPNGSVKSRLDRCLVSEQWLSHWPDSSQHVIQKDFSDHCPIILKTVMVDWGPKPFRLNDIDTIACDRSLTKAELMSKKSIQHDLWMASNAYEFLLRQKSRVKWFKEGDSNTAYFHKTINFRRHHNTIHGIFSEGIWVQQPKMVKDEAVKFFVRRFTKENFSRPTLDGVHFNRITHSQWEEMTAPFSDQELKEAVWSCGGEKSLGLDGFNFNFIKEFWGAMLRGFELASGLKINFAKSQFGIFGAEANWIHEAAQFLNCRHMETPFYYLGIPIGAKSTSNRLPTRGNLLRRNVQIQDNSCPLCGNAQEEVDHLFFNCKMTLGLWWESMSWNQMVGPIASSPASHFVQFCEGYVAGQNQSHRYGWSNLGGQIKMMQQFSTINLEDKERGILGEIEQNKEIVKESPAEKSRSTSIVDGRETKALDMFWFLKPCTLSG